MPSEVQSAIRPSLSPFEYGAYGTPSTRASLVMIGPHDSSDGNEDTMSARDMGAMMDRMYRCPEILNNFIFCGSGGIDSEILARLGLSCGIHPRHSDNLVLGSLHCIKG